MPFLSKKTVVLSKTDNSNLKLTSLNKQNIEKMLQSQDESMNLHYDITSTTSSNNKNLTKKTVRLTVSSSDCAISKRNKDQPQACSEFVSRSMVDRISSSIFDHSPEDMFGVLGISDSGQRLTSEQLNRPDIKEKFIKFSQERGLEEELRRNFEVLSQELLLTETQMNDSPQNSASRYSLTPEEINRPDIKEKFIKFSQETGLEEELRNNFKILSQKLRISGIKKNKKKANPKKKEIRQPNAEESPKKRGRPKKTVPETKKSSNKNTTKTKKLTHQEKKSLDEENKSLEKENTSLEKENTSLQEGNTSLREENTSLEKENTSLEKENTSLEKENTSLEKENISNEEENTLSLYEKMLLIHKSRDVGLYVYCDSCDKVRYLPDTKDPLDLPEKWYCPMNPDKEHNKCSDPEEPIVDEEFLIENKYNAGSIVFAKVNGYPWWPAMVEDDPYVEQYFLLEDSLVPTMYHVSFFDSHKPTVAWIEDRNLKPFKININQLEFKNKKFNKFRIRLNVAVEQASEANMLPLLERLKTYSFINRYKFPNSKNKVIMKTKKKAGETIVNDERQKNKSPEKNQNSDKNMGGKNTKLANKPTKSVLNNEEPNFSKKTYKKILKLMSSEDLENSQRLLLRTLME